MKIFRSAVRWAPACSRVVAWVLLFLAGILPASVHAQTISGKVFQDYNSNGTYEAIPATGSYSYGESGVQGIVIQAFNASGILSGSGVSGVTGDYSFSTVGTGPFRVEFTIPAALSYLNESEAKTAGLGTSVQFTSPGSATLNFGVLGRNDYCQGAPLLVVPCFVSGNPLGSNVDNEHVVVTFPYSTSSTNTGTLAAPVIVNTVNPTPISDAGQIGSVWGMAFQRETKKLFSAAFLKRHVGLASGGLGGIYVTSTAAATTNGSLYVDLESAPFNLDLGQSLLGTRSTIPNSTTNSSTDPTSFSLIGKVGLGSIALSDDGSKLYAVDLFNRQLLILNIGNPAKATLVASDLKQVALPATNCPNGVARPFAVAVHQGKVYVGLVCTAESPGSTSANLSSTIYAMDETTQIFSATPVFTAPLTYPKGFVHAQQTPLGNTWEPWTSTFSDMHTTLFTPAVNGANGTPAVYRTALPQPILSDIDFTDNGDMVISFMDRAGHQLGYRNVSPNGGTTLYNGYVGGDILRAGKQGNSWVLESAGKVISTAGSLTGCGPTDNQGPGGGEFYCEDNFVGDNNSDNIPDEIHQETAMGGSVVIPGTNAVASIHMDPLTTWSGGVVWYNNTTGSDMKRYQLYRTLDNNGVQVNGTYGKANGLGLPVALCDAAPVQIGNRVWIDTDNDGVQDPGELPLAGVTVLLKGPGLPAGGASVTTNANGEYYFSNATGTNTTGFVYSLTGLTAGGSYSLTFPTSASAAALLLSSKSNSASGSNADAIDTDPNTAGVISFTLGEASENNFTYDAAYYRPASLGDYVFIDANKDGIQNTGDSPLPGVTVTLYQNGSAVATTTTNASGLYSFTGLTPGSSNSYVVGFTTPTGYTATISNVGSDTADSDASPATGMTQSVTLTGGENNSTLDAGFYLIPASLGDYVFLDANKDGIQNTGDTPIPGVIVTLYQNGTVVATTTTNGLGLYSFTSLTPGTSNSYSVGFTTPTGYTATISNVGSDTADSDASQVTGRTQSVTLVPGEYNPTLDAGFYLISASLGDYTFIDANKDGTQNAGDSPLAGVKVTLYLNGSAVATTATNGSGLYSFTGLTPGTSNSYVVGFTAPAGYTATISNVGSDTTDSDANTVTGMTQSVTLVPGENNPTLDAGFFLPTASLGNFVFEDVNRDGLQDAGDLPIVGAKVTLLQSGTVAGTTITDVNGLYSFTGLTPGIPYSVSFTTPVGFSAATAANIGSNDAIDSDPVGGITLPVTLTVDENNTSLDAGFVRPIIPASLGDYVFLDANKDGIQNAGDSPLAGVTVTLYRNGSAVATTTTNGSGLYSFTGLTPGTSNSYVVGFTTPAGFTATISNVGSDTADSDADPITGRTQSLTLVPGENNPTLDAGFYMPTAGLGDYVFEDKNANGIQDAGDLPIPGVTVTLYASGTIVGTTTTDANGLYSFTGLTPGTAYTVGFGQPAGYLPTLANVGNDGLDSDASLSTGLTGPYSLTADEFNPTVDAGFYKLASLGDYVFNDKNRDGIQNTGDTPIPGVRVVLYQNGTAVATTTTDATGLYSFTGLMPGTATTYSVGFTQPAGFVSTSANVGVEGLDSDADPVTGRTAGLTLSSGESNTSVDAGYYQPSASLGNFVFEDVNKDGLQDGGDLPIQGAVVTLLQSGTVAGTTTTDGSGLYSFTGLTPGIPYSVSFTTPAGFSTTTTANVGLNDAIDSDPVGGVTAPVTLTAAENNPTLDAGFVRAAPVTYAIAKTVSKSRVAKGEIVTYTLSLTNTSPSSATGIIVTDAFSTSGVSLVGSATASTGTFTPSVAGGTWAIPALGGGAVATLRYQAQINTEGLVYNVATAPGGTSTTAVACLTVPYHVCANEAFEFELSAPASYSAYQWSLNGTPIAGATSSLYSATAVGEYTVATTSAAGCPDGSCCPFVIVADAAPSLTAVAVAASCTGSTPLNNARITLVGSSTNAVSYNISLGSSFTASSPLFATDQPLAGLGVGSELKAGLANPSSAPGTAYTIRVYSAQGCYSDVVVVIPPAMCQCPAPVCAPFVVKKIKTGGR